MLWKLWNLFWYLVDLLFYQSDEEEEDNEEEDNGEEDDSSIVGDGDEEEFVCIICMDAPPETMVLPCRHVTVCRECSLQLVDTPDRYVCCQCRRTITGIVNLVNDNLRKPGEIVERKC